MDDFKTTKKTNLTRWWIPLDMHHPNSRFLSHRQFVVYLCQPFPIPAGNVTKIELGICFVVFLQKISIAKYLSSEHVYGLLSNTMSATDKFQSSLIPCAAILKGVSGSLPPWWTTQTFIVFLEVEEVQLSNRLTNTRCAETLKGSNVKIAKDFKMNSK